MCQSWRMVGIKNVDMHGAHAHSLTHSLTPTALLQMATGSIFFSFSLSFSVKHTHTTHHEIHALTFTYMLSSFFFSEESIIMQLWRGAERKGKQPGQPTLLTNRWNRMVRYDGMK